MMAIHLLVS